VLVCQPQPPSTTHRNAWRILFRSAIDLLFFIHSAGLETSIGSALAAGRSRDTNPMHKSLPVPVAGRIIVIYRAADNNLIISCSFFSFQNPDLMRCLFSFRCALAGSADRSIDGAGVDQPNPNRPFMMARDAHVCFGAPRACSTQEQYGPQKYIWSLTMHPPSLVVAN
jgi:hypothetical protein